MAHPWVMDKNCVKHYPDPRWQRGVLAHTQFFRMCTLWSWPLRYILVSRSLRTVVSWKTIVWNIIQIKHGSEEVWPGHGFWVWVHSDLDLRDLTLGQDQDTLWGHGELLCEILSRSEKGVRSYVPDTMWTDGHTDRRTDRVIPIYLQTLFAGGGGYTNCKWFSL